MSLLHDKEKNAEIHNLIQICSKDFQIKNDKNIEHKNFQDVINWLRKEIQYLLDHDLQKLLNIMYRIDISETEFKKVLANSQSDNISGKLTELIVERELQKVKFRKKYQSK